MREPNVALYTMITIVGVTLLGAFIALSVVIGEHFAVPALITSGIVGVLALRGPVGKALAERIHQGAAGAGTDPVLLEEMDEMRTRMVELEERVDFTERLLAQHRADDPAALPPA